MEACLSHIKTHHFCSSLSIPKTKNPPISSHPIRTHQIPLSDRSLKLGRRRQQNRQFGDGWSVVECAKGGWVSELERKLEDEMNSEEEWKGIEGRWREKCKGRRGIVELMECLEREAIMGEDEGREPTDYNRRAQIFDKSSRVFQALKESSDS